LPEQSWVVVFLLRTYLLLLISDTVELADGRFVLSGCLPAGRKASASCIGGAGFTPRVTLLGFHPEFLGGLLLDFPATILADPGGPAGPPQKQKETRRTASPGF
jgi:hypothetical protein